MEERKKGRTREGGGRIRNEKREMKRWLWDEKYKIDISKCNMSTKQTEKKKGKN